MIKDLKLSGSSEVLKVATESKLVRLVEGDHKISCKMGGIAIGLKACFVGKVVGPCFLSQRFCPPAHFSSPSIHRASFI